MADRRKHEVITFKVDEALSRAMRGIENRSAFIRAAILSALENTCPLCLGTGILTPDQRTHWREFEAGHSVRECDECHALYLACHSDAPAPPPHT